jgi:hypothetical protein
VLGKGHQHHSLLITVPNLKIFISDDSLAIISFGVIFDDNFHFLCLHQGEGIHAMSVQIHTKEKNKLKRGGFFIYTL